MDYDALERLVRLRDSGALTEQEFAEQKSILSDPVQNAVDSRRQRQQRRWQTPVGLTAITTVVLGGAALAYFNNPGLISSIDARPSEERQCQSSIKASLLNPETVEFFEFQSASREDYLSQFEEKLRGELEEGISASGTGTGLSGIYAQGMASATAGIISKHVRDAVSQERTRLNEQGFRIFAYRIKADGKLGNTITSTQYCTVSATSCECV